MNLSAVFSNRIVRIAAILLTIQIAAFYLLANEEKMLPDATLAAVPRQFSGWSQYGDDIPVDQETMDLLKADQVLNRSYLDPARRQALSLFVAFFRSQRAGVSPHSPKVCLPGSGWVPRDSHTINLSVPGVSEPIPVNRYVVSRGEHTSVVLYWYQSAHRAVANEYAAKGYLMVDAIRYRRSDTSLIRVVVPVAEGQSENDAQAIGEKFIRDLYQPVRSNLPV